MNFNSIWKSYLNEEKELELLTEARVKDIKKKYPILDKAGWIKYGRSRIEEILGPKGTSKYLMWFARELHYNFEDEMEDNPEWTGTGDDEVDDVTEVANALLEAIMTFQENQQRMEEKDIYKFNSGELQMALSKLGLSSSQLRDKEKAAAMETTQIVYDDNDIFAVRPLDEVSSCYFGKHTRWCISATNSRNYFDQYTSDNKAFVMVRFGKIPSDHKFHKLALVYNTDGDLEEVFDAPDDEVGDAAINQAVSLHFGEEDYELITDEDKREEIDDIVSDIIGSGYHNVLDNPPDPSVSWEKSAESLEEKYGDLIKYASYSYDIDDYGEGSYMSFWGSFNIELDNEIFEDAEYVLPSGWQAESALTRELVDKLSRQQIYFEEIELLDNSGVTEFYLRFSTEDYEGNPEGYENFLDNIVYTERNYSAIRRIILKHLAEEKYIKPGVFDTFRTTLDDVRRSLKNFKIEDLDYVGEEEVRFETLETIPIDIPGGDLSLVAKGSNVAGRYHNPELTKKVVLKLQDLNQAVQTYLAMQLELPIRDLPPRVVQSLSIPDSLDIYMHKPSVGSLSSVIDTSSTNVPVAATVRISLDNPEADQEELDMIMNVVKFIDKNYERVRSAVMESGAEIREDMLKAQRDFEESMPEETRQFIALAKTSYHPEVQEGLSKLSKYTAGAYSAMMGWIGGGDRGGHAGTQYVYNMIRSTVLRPIWKLLKEPDPARGKPLIDPESPEPPWFYDEVHDELMSLTLESRGMQSDIDRYFKRIDEEKGRSRQRGIYKFYCMIGYQVIAGDKQRGLDDILGDIRAIPGVTIVTVVVSNRKIADHRYISGLAIKFIPSIPGSISSPEDAKARIVKNIKRVSSVDRIFKISTSFERIE